MDPGGTLIRRRRRSGDFFGTSVAISGSLIVVGAPFSDPKVGDVHVTNAGAAYVFKQKSDSWEQRAELIASDPVSFAEFGQSVAVEAGTISVGAEGATQAVIRRQVQCICSHSLPKNGPSNQKSWRITSKKGKISGNPLPYQTMK